MTENTWQDLQGDVLQSEVPDWEPLRLAVGDELLEWFMWMFEIELSDGVRVHAYKHQTTRRYLYLTEDAEAYRYHGSPYQGEPSRYASMPLPMVLEDTLSYWWDSPHADAESIDHGRKAIERARARYQAQLAEELESGGRTRRGEAA